MGSIKFSHLIIGTNNGVRSVVINNPKIEKKASKIATLYFQPEQVIPQKKGLFGALFSIFKKN